MPVRSVRRTDYSASRESALAAYLKQPRAAFINSRHLLSNPRYPVYMFAGKYYLVFRTGEIPKLNGYTFQRVFVAHGAPWTIFRLIRHPSNFNAPEEDRRQQMVDAMQRGLDISSYPVRDIMLAYEECQRRWAAAERELRQYRECPRQERQAMADLAQRVTQERERAQELERRLMQSTPERVRELEAECAALRNNLEETQGQLADAEYRAEELQGQCREYRHELAQLRNPPRVPTRRAAAPPPPRVTRNGAAPDPLAVPDEQWD